MTHHSCSPPRAAALVLALTLVTPSFTAAQTASSGPPASVPAQTGILGTPAFANLIAGKQVIVTTTDGLQYVGIFNVSGNTIVASGSKSNLTVPFDHIARVQKDSFRIRHHSLIGLGVGFGVGVALAVSACGGDCDGEPWWLLFGGISAGIGAGVGAGVGGILNAVNSENDVIYDARRRTTTMAIGPIVSSTRKGVAFTLSWR